MVLLGMVEVETERLDTRAHPTGQAGRGRSASGRHAGPRKGSAKVERVDLNALL